MPRVTIQGTTINIPNTGSSPVWSTAILEFIQAVADALSGVAGDYDVPPQVLDLTNEVNTDLNIPKLVFPTTEVRSVIVTYAIYRQSDAENEVETGTIDFVYDSEAGSWIVSREAVGSDRVGVTFNVTNTGQVRISTTAMASGTYQEGALSYQAKAVLQSEV